MIINFQDCDSIEYRIAEGYPLVEECLFCHRYYIREWRWVWWKNQWWVLSNDY